MKRSLFWSRQFRKTSSRGCVRSPELAPSRCLYSQCSPDEFLFRLSDPRRFPIDTPVAIVVAHPDDESIGVGAHLPLLRNAILILLTDGSPRNLADAHRLGFPDARSYARARQKEFEEALALTGVPKARCIHLGIPDQETAFCLGKITRRLAALFEMHQTEIVLTHPYEGGHPDHDAAAFCVHSAVALIANPIPIVEMAFYHLQGGHLVPGEFLPNASTQPLAIRLSSSGKELKRELYQLYRTQYSVLEAFPVDREQFRHAPDYDFTQAPAPEELNYDRNDFGVTGGQFRALVRLAIQEFRSGNIQ